VAGSNRVLCEVDGGSHLLLAGWLLAILATSEGALLTVVPALVSD
jgi:hypothetical protein